MSGIDILAVSDPTFALIGVTHGDLLISCFMTRVAACRICQEADLFQITVKMKVCLLRNSNDTTDAWRVVGLRRRKCAPTAAECHHDSFFKRCSTCCFRRALNLNSMF